MCLIGLGLDLDVGANGLAVVEKRSDAAPASASPTLSRRQGRQARRRGDATWTSWAPDQVRRSLDSVGLSLAGWLAGRLAG